MLRYYTHEFQSETKLSCIKQLCDWLNNRSSDSPTPQVITVEAEGYVDQSLGKARAFCKMVVLYGIEQVPVEPEVDVKVEVNTELAAGVLKTMFQGISKEQREREIAEILRKADALRDISSPSTDNDITKG